MLGGKHINFLNVLLLFIGLCMLSVANAQTKKTSRILFLLDGSQSMYSRWESGHKMTTAKNKLINILENYGRKPNIQFALRVYGHTSPENLKNCTDTRLEVPFGPNNLNSIRKRLEYITPTGTTPIAYSLQKTAGDFSNDPNSRNIIILITDGLEACGGDPCHVSLELQKKNIILKPFVIGISMSIEAINELKCIGTTFNAKTEQAFESIMDNIIEKSIGSTTLQVDLLDQNNKPTETNTNMSFYENDFGIVKHNFYHTLNQRGLPDTFLLDPILNYDMTVHTNPPSYTRNIKLSAKKHNIIPVKVPQGNLRLDLLGTTLHNNIEGKIKCLVRKAGSNNLIYVQDFHDNRKYIKGKYDLEFLTLPRIYMKNVDIAQSKTTTIQVPAPGLVTVSFKYLIYGGIFIEIDNKLKKIHELNSKGVREVIALQPGSYKVIYRSKFANKSTLTNEKDFSVNSNGSTAIRLD